MKLFKNKTKSYFILYVALAIVEVAILLVCLYAYRINLYNYEELKFHEKDRIAAKYFEEYSGNNYASKIFTEDNDTVLVYIDENGDILKKSENSSVAILGDNLFLMLKKIKVYNMTADEAKQQILSGEDGRFDVYYTKQQKVLVYTASDDGNHFIVRIIPAKQFKSINMLFDKAVKHAIVFAVIMAIITLLLVVRVRRLVVGMEAASDRHNLIAEDNEMISFIYHPSIASFELSGAVNKVFGEDIAVRGQIDWNTMSKLIHEDDQMLLRNISNAMKTCDSRYTSEFRMKCAESGKEYHWFRITGKTIASSNGESRRFVGTIQNSDDQIVHENMLKNKAEHDLLTGLLNKVTTQEAINRAIMQAKHSLFAFYIIDLDNFKSVNDNLGHASGDEVLSDVASSLKLVFNETDIIGRIGGDEFAVLLVIPSIMTSQADKLIREKAQAINDILRKEYGNEAVKIGVSASIGIARCPEVGHDFETLYKCADKALYFSKENGKDRYTFYNDLK